MNNVWRYLLVGGLVFVLAFFVAVPLFGGWGPFEMMGYRGTGPGMMGGFPMMGFGVFGWLIMLGMWLVPLAVVALLVAGVMALFRATTVTPVGTPPAPTSEAHPCPNCGKHVQNGWVACPYCGEKL